MVANNSFDEVLRGFLHELWQQVLRAVGDVLVGKVRGLSRPPQ